MSEKQRPRTIVLALDTSPEWHTLETALNLAMLMQARLVGLFVEDMDLLRVAALPFAREIVAISAQMRPIASEALEQALKSQALLLQRQLAHEAEARQLEWAFSVVRDRLVSAVRNAASEADLFIMQSPHLRQRGSATAKIGVVFDGTMAAIDTAAQLAHGGTVRVMLNKPLENRRSEITQRIIRYGAHPAFITLHDTNITTISEVARHQHLSMLILPDSFFTGADIVLQPLLESTPCTVVVKDHSTH